MKRDHFVYVFKVKGVPFYVGHGHAGRAKDRVKHAIRLMNREERKDPHVPWQMNTRVIAGLLRARETQITYEESRPGLTKPEASDREKLEIRRLLAEGYVLANKHHNPNGERCWRVIVDGLLKRIGDLK